MALSIKNPEADELARQLACLTGESMTEALTAALCERLAHETMRRQVAGDLPRRLTELSERMRVNYDTHAVSPEEWAAACGDEG
jgi:antitoxin VapB